MAVSIYCPHCHRHTDLRTGTFVSRDNNSPYVYKTISREAVCNELGDDRWWIGICNGCQHPMLVCGEGEIIYPSPLPSPSSEDILEPLRNDLDEAKKCLAAGCFRATAVMARRVVQRACIAKQAPEGNLVSQINHLADNNIITADIKDWATVVRWVGNDAAHDENDVTPDEAKDALSLAEEFLHILFVTPAVAQRRRTERQQG